MTLLDWYAGQEKIGDEELSAGICEHFAGPKPGGNWSTNPADWYAWEARWRAGVKYMRASAMLAEKARREATGKDCLTVPNHSPDALKTAKQPDACALLRKFIDAVPEGFETSLLWDLRKDAIHLLDVVPDHSPDAGKMALEAANRELVEALEACNAAFSKFAPQEGSAYGAAWVKVRTILAKHKGAA
jgi:hypothetical protein